MIAWWGCARGAIFICYVHYVHYRNFPMNPLSNATSIAKAAPPNSAALSTPLNNPWLIISQFTYPNGAPQLKGNALQLVGVVIRLKVLIKTNAPKQP